MTALTFPLRPPRLAFAICGWRWQKLCMKIRYGVCVCGLAGLSHVEIYATGSQSQTHVTATTEMPMQSIRSYK